MSDRAARLAALRVKAGKGTAAPVPSASAPVTIKHRNYEPAHDEDEVDADDGLDEAEEASSKRRKVEPEDGDPLASALSVAQATLQAKNTSAVPGED